MSENSGQCVELLGEAVGCRPGESSLAGGGLSQGAALCLDRVQTGWARARAGTTMKEGITALSRKCHAG